MSDFDEFSNNLLEEAKWFLEISQKATIEKENAYKHASLLLSISALEAFINGIADDFSDSTKLSLVEKSLLLEKEIILLHGSFKLSNRLKVSRLNDKIEFIYFFFKKISIDKTTSSWWANLQNGIELRNRIVHPKELTSLSYEQLKDVVLSVINCVNELFQIIYGKGLPNSALGIESKIF